MNLRVLGSNSSGNCYLIESDLECLVLEAGLPFKNVKKALDFNVGKIVGVVVSHQHGDHFGHAEEYLKSGIQVYAPEETHKSLSKEYLQQKVVRPGYWYKAGGFEITPFEVEHDVQCFGYIIRHPELGSLLFATDSAFIRQNFKGVKLNHIMIECNYSEEIINARYAEGSIERSRIDRVLKTHMSLETCREFVRVNKTGNLDNVVLLHLSDGNSDERAFREDMQAVVGDDVRVTVADTGVSIKLDLFPW